MIHDVWVEVDLSALKHNLRQVRSLLADNIKLMAVVKSNGFGHGYVEPSRAFVEAGADALAVTRLDEAMQIRNAGIDAPILLFAPIQPENAEAAVEADLQMTVSSISLVRAISNTALRLEKTAKIHVKVDTGMGRLGLAPSEVIGFFNAIKGLTNIEVAGIYTHFSSVAENSLASSQAQLQRFNSLLDSLRESGNDYGIAHSANSGALIRMPDSHLDMVRPGTLLYGQYPSQFVPHTIDLKPTWKLKARICEIKTLAKGSPVGYGAEVVTKRETKIAIIPVGYADGFTLVPEGSVYRQSIPKFVFKKMRRSLSVEINGRKVPVIGRVAMQMMAVDITDVAAKIGDEVTIPALRIPTSALIPRVYSI